MARCAGIKRDGGQCTTIVKPPQTYCYQHDPERSEERKRNAHRAGKARGSGEVSGIKSEIGAVIAGVLAGDVPTGRAAVAMQGYNTLLRAVEVERKVRELDDLEERIAAMEGRVNHAAG